MNRKIMISVLAICILTGSMIYGAFTYGYNTGYNDGIPEKVTFSVRIGSASSHNLGLCNLSWTQFNELLSDTDRAPFIGYNDSWYYALSIFTDLSNTDYSVNITAKTGIEWLPHDSTRILDRVILYGFTDELHFINTYPNGAMPAGLEVIGRNSVYLHIWGRGNWSYATEFDVYGFLDISFSNPYLEGN